MAESLMTGVLCKSGDCCRSSGWADSDLWGKEPPWGPHVPHNSVNRYGTIGTIYLINNHKSYGCQISQMFWHYIA